MRRIVMPVRVLLLSSLFVIAAPAWAQECVRDDMDPFVPADDARCVPGGEPFNARAGFRDPATANSFSLSPPGARSLAMGGAFLGLADDATAAYTNPAGLTNLAVGGSEVAVEIRGAEYSSQYVDRGHYNTDGMTPPDLTFVGQDVVEDLQLGNADGNVTGLSFLSYGFVFPGGLTAAVYRHEVGNFQSEFGAQGPFNDYVCGKGRSQRECDLFRVNPSRSSINLEIVNYGVSAAYAFDIGSASSLSVGLGISFYEADMDRTSDTFDLCRFDDVDPTEEPLHQFVDPDTNQVVIEPFPCTQDEPRSRMPGAFYGVPDFSRDNAISLTSEVANDEAFGINVGFLWKIGRDRRLSIGGVFRQGPDFDSVQESFFNDEDDFDPITFEENPGTLTVPDVIGLGVAYRTADGKTKFTFDWNRVRYSQTLKDFTANLDDFDDDFELDDIDQFHVGVERIVLVVESLFVGSARLGAWLEPNHRPKYDGDDTDLEAAFGIEPDDDLHLSLGFGLVIKEDYQLDFAANFSDSIDNYSFAVVKFF